MVGDLGNNFTPLSQYVQDRVVANERAEQVRKAAEEEASLAMQRARDVLRDQVAALAVAGAEQILRREIDAARHAELLTNLSAELHGQSQTQGR